MKWFWMMAWISWVGSLPAYAEGIPMAMCEGLPHEWTIAPDGQSGVLGAWVLESPDQVDLQIQRIDFRGHSKWGKKGLLLYRSPHALPFLYLHDDGQGGAFLAWVEKTSNDGRLWLQHVDRSAHLLWPSPGLLLRTAHTIQAPQMDMDQKGQVFLAWQEEGSEGQSTIHMVILPRGKSLASFSLIKVPMETGSSQSGPSISSDHQEGFSLAWTQVDKGRATLLAQYFDAMAKPVWNREGMNLAHSRVVAQLETLRWSQERILIAVWREHGGAGDVWKAQALDAAGQRLWSLDGFEMVAENAGDENPAVVVNENGHIFIAWEEPKPDSRRILVQKWNPKGLQEWNLSGVPVATGEQGEQRDCTLSEGKEDIYAVWRCSVGDHPWTLYAQHLGADGTRLWGKGRILSEQPLPGQRPLAIRDDYGGLIAAWLEQGAPHEWQMKTMRLDSEGHPVWAVK